MKIYIKETQCDKSDKFFGQNFKSKVHYLRVNDDRTIDEHNVFITKTGGFQSTPWKKTDLEYNEDSILMAGYEMQPSFELLKCKSTRSF
jgi:hypothetical protein